MGPSIHPSTHRGHRGARSLRTRGWHTEHTSGRAVIFPFMTWHRTKQKHGVAIKWITLLDPALLICRRPAPIQHGYKRGWSLRDAVFLKLYGSCNSPPAWLSAGAAGSHVVRSIFINSCERVFHKYTILLVISHRNSNPAWNSYCCRAHKAWMDAARSLLSNPSKIPFAQNRFGRARAPGYVSVWWALRLTREREKLRHSSALRTN